MIVGIYKKENLTSHDIVDEVRRITGIRKVGHAGTLDPLAKGVLVIGIGRKATKALAQIVKKEKEYLAEILLGATSPTDDREGKKTRMPIFKTPSLEEIKKTILTFKGKICQKPPPFSAIKIKGTPAYKLARKGKDFELPEREVEIKKIELLSYQWPLLKIKVTTGPGVYIRSLARDIGKKLKTGGYLNELERTRVGEFKKEKSLSLKQFSKVWQNLKENEVQ